MHISLLQTRTLRKYTSIRGPIMLASLCARKVLSFVIGWGSFESSEQELDASVIAEHAWGMGLRMLRCKPLMCKYWECEWWSKSFSSSPNVVLCAWQSLCWLEPWYDPCRYVSHACIQGCSGTQCLIIRGNIDIVAGCRTRDLCVLFSIYVDIQ